MIIGGMPPFPLLIPTIERAQSQPACKPSQSLTITISPAGTKLKSPSRWLCVSLKDCR